MQSQSDRRRLPLKTFAVAMVAAFLTAGVPTVVNAVDTIYWDGVVNSGSWKQSAQQSYLTGGRNGLTSTLTVLKAQTLTSTGAVYHSATMSEGAAVDFTHARVNNARSRCSFVFAVPDISGTTHLICKYRK